MRGLSARLLGVLEGWYRPRAEEVGALAEVARLNKLYLPFLRAVRDTLPGEWAVEEGRFRRFVEGCVEVGRALAGLDYAFFKFRRPVDHVSVDLDVLVRPRDVGAAVKRLRGLGFEVVVAEPYTVTLSRGDFVVDLYTHPSFAWVVYMDGEQLLDYAEDFELGGAVVRGLSREAEVAVAAAHAVYKEHMVLLLDCLTVGKWLSGAAVRVAEELGVGYSLGVVLSACRAVEEGLAEAPYKLPLPALLAAYLDKARGDGRFVASLPNLTKSLARRRGARLLWERLTRKSY